MESFTEQILKSSVPTRLIVGDLENTRTVVELALRSKFCLQQTATESCFCSECRKIKNRQHPFLLWLCPEKDYSVDDIDVIFDKIRFALNSGEKFFFVLDKAQNLNSASANRILKVLEEPPAGYEFILLTDNKNLILPTILSRSFVVQLQAQNSNGIEHPVLQYFCKSQNLPDPVVFDQQIKKLHLSENESVELANALLEFFIKKISAGYQNSASNSESEFYKNGLEILRNRLKTPPASGGSTLFWKLLYLDFAVL